MHYNYHTHTYRCHHADGTEREYIETAISGGIKKMGFSDHIPFRFPDGYESSYRIRTEKAEEYIRTIKALKEEYKDKIEIHIGFEMEYYALYFKEMLDNARKWGAEYLILGQHYIGNEYPRGASCTRGSSLESELCEYSSSVVEAIKTGVFSCVAHPDIFKYSGQEKAYIREMRRICVASKEYEIPLEINLLGIRDNRFYPVEKFWEIAGEEKAPVVFGFDSHDTASAYDRESLPRAEELVRKYKLNILPELELIDIRK